MKKWHWMKQLNKPKVLIQFLQSSQFAFGYLITTECFIADFGFWTLHVNFRRTKEE